MCNEILIKDESLTVTYNSDCPIPNNDYGMVIPVQVYIDTSGSTDKAKDTITIKIGDNNFLPHEVKKWAAMIERAEMIADAVQK